jgi:hypothetical protein
VSKRDRYDSDRRGERRDSQPDDEQQRRSGEVDPQESDSLSALKAILSKVSALLNPLQLTQEESIRLVEQLYGSVLETDVRLAGEADDTRKSSVLAHIQNTNITRDGGKIVVEYPSGRETAGEKPPLEEPSVATAPAEKPRAEKPPVEKPPVERPPVESAPTES